jgi:hypothetical protein
LKAMLTLIIGLLSWTRRSKGSSSND